MTRTMYDAVTVGNIPASATLVAGYVDGHYMNVGGMRARFPHATIVQIAVSSHTNAGHVLDVETGDATPTEAVAWVKMRRSAGADPSVYCNTSIWPTVRAAFRNAGVTEPHYWIANWDGSPVIPAGAVAKQYASTDAIDTSSVAAYWPGVDTAAPTNPPVPPVNSGSTYTVKAGDTLSGIAVSHGMTLHDLEAANPQITNFNNIYPGQVIHLHAGGPIKALYTVLKGDTLSSIAQSHGTTWTHLASINGLKNPDMIYPGQKLRLS